MVRMGGGSGQLLWQEPFGVYFDLIYRAGRFHGQPERLPRLQQPVLVQAPSRKVTLTRLKPDAFGPLAAGGPTVALDGRATG